MSFFSWLRNRTSNSTPRGRAERRPATPGFRPQLEALEDRWLPSTLTVTSAAASGPGSLRADLAAAQNNDTIVFDPSLDGQTIRLTSGQLALTQNLTIQGPGSSQLTISGNNASRVFEVSNATVTIAGLTISNGYASVGAGIWNYFGHLTVSSCTLSNNRATNSGYGGGGIANWNGSSLTVSGCTLSGNRADSGGGIWNAGTATVSASTLSGNSAFGNTGNGGGIYNRGTMTLSSSTVTSGSAGVLGAGIFNDRGGNLSILSKSAVYNNYIHPQSGGSMWENDLFVQSGSGTVTISSDSYVGHRG